MLRAVSRSATRARSLQLLNQSNSIIIRQGLHHTASIRHAAPAGPFDSATELQTVPQESNVNDFSKSNIFVHRLPESTAEQSPLLVSLHSRLNLSPRFKLSTLSQCLNMVKTSSPEGEGLANNFGLNTMGKTLLSYYVTEHLLLHYPRLPMSIHNAAVDSLMGVEALSQIGKSFGIEVDSVSKLDRFLGQESEFIKYGRLRFMTNDEIENKVNVHGIEEVIGGTSSKHRLLKQEDLAHASAVRSIVGGIYTHCGEDAARQFISDHILSRKLPLEQMFEFDKPIAELIRLCDKLEFKEPVKIRLIAETGRKSAHPQFLAGVFVGTEKLGEGIGSSLKEAQIRASVNSLLGYYLYSPISTDGSQVKVPSDTEYKFEGIVDGGEVAI
ncbi:MRPL3 [Candida theae]|uniref:MRPL3 n=1 Tax=Candida theae TaxID=1198502 RepID=A0AAD5BED3_9ASCO|nr:MRPL3 [Candida theae]KAI5958062.1 MRPL3 [Candida theae]